jgi:hypothetical protein
VIYFWLMCSYMLSSIASRRKRSYTHVCVCVCVCVCVYDLFLLVLSRTFLLLQAPRNINVFLLNVFLIRIHMYAYTCTRTHVLHIKSDIIHTHTITHTHNRTHTHTYIHACIHQAQTNIKQALFLVFHTNIQTAYV